jgi:hypothetical protein
MTLLVFLLQPDCCQRHAACNALHFWETSFRPQPQAVSQAKTSDLGHGAKHTCRKPRS